MHTSISSSLSLSPARVRALGEAGVHHTEDLLNFPPRRYLDRKNTARIANLSGKGEEITIMGHIKEVQLLSSGRKKRLEAVITDGSGTLKCVWFRGVGYFKKYLEKGDYVSIYGKVKKFGPWLSMAHPDLDKLRDPAGQLSSFGIIPVYPGNAGFKKAYINSALLQKWAGELLDEVTFEEYLPDYLRSRHKLCSRNLAYRFVHLPEHLGQAKEGRKRLKFDELFFFEMAIHVLKLRNKEKQPGLRIKAPGALTKHFFTQELPFELTEGQRNALSDIRRDLAGGHQMNRLLQGDVGSGKTIVAIGAMLMLLDNGYQAAFMAPTEILAEQHFRTLSQYFEALQIPVRLLTGKTKAAQKREIREEAANGTLSIMVGTHALIQDGVEFQQLGIAIIDEQHRFGVKQRARFQQHHAYPHILAMSATPIPRSLAMTVFGNMDISVIKGLPAGRKPIRTALRFENKREKVMAFLADSVRQGGQIYVVYPLVEESELLDLKSATDGYEQLRHRFPELHIGLLHGRMKPNEKEAIMQSFERGETDILVSTTVIEVGINVPNASVMVIEQAERFGLSQLHQLRGRIGRGSRQSYCILMADYKRSKVAIERLETMVKTNDGFEIAEADLRLRGPGDFLGTKQSGIPDFKFADILRDEDLLELAREEAQRLLTDDPKLEREEHQHLKKHLREYLRARKDFYSMM